ncbi:MAG: hypothetical protein J6X94_04305 [Lachnospiraceae bacterium]|nr:hypothetical protein [Lachnospiraceae bacterium]
MKKNILISMSLLMVIGITACGNANVNVSDNNIEIPEITAEPITDRDDADSDYEDPLPAIEDDGLDAPDVVTDEEALDAVISFMSSTQPEVISNDDYTEYFIVESSTPEQIVVLYRSYTASQTRFYIDRATGETKVTELVPGIIDEETETGEEFNIKNYIGDGDIAAAPAYSDDSLMNYIWYTASIITDKDGNSRPEWEVRFAEDAIEYGYDEDDKFVLDHSDKICSIDQFSEHGFIVQAETANGVQYTYRTAEDDETILEYYGTWDESKYADNYSGSASLFR